MKLNTSKRHIKKVGKNLKIKISSLKIETKEKDYTTTNIKNIISLLQVFNIYL